MPLTQERTKVRAHLTRRFFIRNHMTLILLGVFFSGLGASALLRFAGIETLALRYALAVTLSYVTFFVLVRIWLWYVLAEQHLSAGDAVEGALELADAGGDIAGASGVDGGDIGGLDEGFLILVALGLLLLVLFGSAAYLVYEAPVILSEAAFQVVLTSLLVRPSKKIDEPGWIGSVFRATWIPFALTLAIAAVLGYVIHVECPAATKLADAWRGVCARPE